MDPIRKNEYQKHQSHHPQQLQHVTSYSQHVVRNYITPQHHKPQQQQQPPAAAPQQQQQEPPQQHVPPLPHYQLGGSSSLYPSSINYHNTQPADAERSRSTIYVMSSRSAASCGGGAVAASSVLPPTGADATASGDDPHFQYYTSNRELTVGKRLSETTSYPGWQYKTTGATGMAPVPRNHSSNICNAPYWLQDEQQQQQLHSIEQQSRLSYGKSQTATRPSAIGCSSSNISIGSRNGDENHFRYYEDNSKYSTVGSRTKVSYAPAPTSRYEVLEHGVNPSNELLGTSDQQPSPNYARKCPQHYEAPTEQHCANHKVISSQIPHQHQSLYMPSNFQNTVHNAIEKYVRETAPAPNLDYTRKNATFTRPSASYYGQSAVGGNNSTGSSSACVKLEPESPALTRSSLYHNPYSPATAPSADAAKEKEELAPVAVAANSHDTSALLAHAYPTKYGKVLPQHATPTTTRSAIVGEQRRSSFSSINNYTGHYHHGTPSPASDQVASPLPTQQQYNQTPPPTAGIHSNVSNYSTLQVYPHGPDICCQPSMALKSAPSLPSGPKKAPPTSKPNYRALINDMLKRNTTSEEELNLQIIKKTLNMESPGSRLPTVATSTRQSPVTIAVHPMLTPIIHEPQQQLNPQQPSQPVLFSTLPSAQSPLDLSMRTIKQTADSTEYKYQRMPTDSLDRVTGTGTGLGLPRFDITPNFARTNRIVSSPLVASPTAVIRQTPANIASPVEATSMVIKAAQQLRPSVLETNPYAKRPQLPPETTIKALPKSVPSPSTTSINTSVSTITVGAQKSSNPNYLGRKRHLQEYNQATAAAAAAVEAATAAAKQSRLEIPQKEDIVESLVPVIAVNEHAQLAKRVEEPIIPSSSRVIVCSHPKQGQLAMPKTESRIRTKAELKGFTFTTPVLVMANSTTTASTIPEDMPTDTSTEANNSVPLDTNTPVLQPNNNIPIKLEPAPTPEFDVKEVEDGDAVRFNRNSLFDWGSTCNNLVKQLLSKALPAKTTTSGNESFVPISRIKLELSEDDLPVARILKRQPLAADVESAATTTTQLTNTTTTNGNAFGAAQKKLSKTEREKKRMIQEQRIAARLAPTAGHSSSSESDTTELRKRKTARQKKPLMRKSKVRRADEKEMQMKHCEQTSSDEEQNQEQKRIKSSSETKILTNVSKSKISTFKKSKVQYTSDICNKDNVEKQQGRVLEQKQNLDKDADHKSSSNSGNSDYEEPQDEQNEDAEDVHDGEESGNALEDSISNQSKRKAKPILKNRIALNTMTRSKRKKELELQIANSKVLRNDKIIRNSTTKIKRKYVRKLVPDVKKDIMITRLRNKRDEFVDRADLSGRKLKNNSNKKSGRQTCYNTKNSPTNTTPQQQLFLEEYRYKLALKIPQRLISINKLNKLPHVAASLPDLERGHYLTQDMASFKTTRGRKPRSKQQQLSQQQQKATPKSIIDVLHLRVTSNGSQQQRTNTNLNNSSNSLHNYSETSQTSASNSLYDHLQEVTEHSMEDSLGKRHFSIFETKVLQSKTRTESKLQQRREIIREIFVGTERPASAPPECAQHDQPGEESSVLSYQQYEDFLDQMNRIVSANNNKLSRHSICGEEKQKPETVPSRPIAYKRKYLRRKRSSGFDYIRKKKRPTTHHHQSTNNNNTSNINTVSGEHAVTHISAPHVAAEAVAGDIVLATTTTDERLDDTDSTIAGSTSHMPIMIKTEMDVCREIQKWVLNKGVGQSTMHKAARQGLIDVVVYCLDRMGMNPDLKDNAGYTPLHEACTQGWLEIARILLQFGANHSEAAQSGIRPLHGAIENDHEEVVRLLLSYGADPLLATYSGQTPLMLASSKLMFSVLSNHLSDAQSAAADIKPMRFQGPWEIFDEKEYGFNIFDNVPNTACDMSRAQPKGRSKQERSHGDNDNPAKPTPNRKSSNINQFRERRENKGKIKENGEINAKTVNKTIITLTAIATETATTVTKTDATTATVKIESDAGIEDTNNNNNNREKNDINIEKNVTSVVNGKNEVKLEPEDVENLSININVKGNEIVDDRNDHVDIGHEYDDDDGETFTDELNGDIFKFEEADVPLPPLYLLKDEGSDKWVLLNDLCNLLKVKSKDTLLNKICPNGNSLASNQKQLLREFKIDDFLEQATCLQLLCAGEKLNMFSSSKVVLIRYNDSVRNLLGVKTIVMKF